MKTIAGAIVVLAGSILAASGGFGDQHMNHPLVMFGFVVGVIGFAVIALGWRQTKD